MFVGFSLPDCVETALAPRDRFCQTHGCQLTVQACRTAMGKTITLCKVGEESPALKGESIMFIKNLFPSDIEWWIMVDSIFEHMFGVKHHVSMEHVPWLRSI